MNKIFKNSFFNIIQAIIVTPIFFILVPYSISKLGAEGYGLFALIGVISSYQVFVEMGLTTTIVRFVAKANLIKDFKAIGEYLSTALIIFLSISTIALLIIFFSAHFFAVSVFAIKSNVDLAVFLIKVSAVTGIVNLISGLFKSILDGLQRMDISNIILTSQVLLSAVGTFFVLETGYGLKGLIINGLLVSIISFAANIIFSKRLIHYKLNLLSFNKQRFNEMYRYGVNLQLSSLVYFWTEPLNKILISHFIGVAYVGYYDIALKFSGRITNLVRSSLSSLFPASSETFEKSGYEGIENLRIKTLRYVYPLVLLIYILGIIYTPSFVNLWLGLNYKIVSMAIIILLIGSCISILSTPTYVLLMGAGYSQDTLKVQVQGVIVNIISVVTFALLFGFYGFCSGYTLSMIYGFFVTHFYYRKRFDKELRVFKIFVDPKIFLFCLLVMILGIFVFYVIPIVSWLIFIILAGLLFLISLVLIWKLEILTEKDICVLLGKTTYREVYTSLKYKI